MKIAIDVMGGDNFPSANIDGVFDYLESTKSKDIHFILVGNKSLIKKYLNNKSLPDKSITIVNTTDIIDNTDKPSRVFKTKPDSSLVKCINLLKTNEVDAVISSGNTGALLATSLFLLGTIHNIKRPALAPYIPSKNNGFILCDAGANVDTKPEHLVQFAMMSKAYLENVENINNPKIGLLNIGKEPNKGNELTKQTYELLKSNFSNFIGNIEPRYILDEDVDILICDGFTGNIVLKLTEGIFHNIFKFINTPSKTNKISIQKNSLINNLENKFDYEEHGGTPILGIKKIVIKCHGSSSKKSIEKSIETAQILYKKKVIDVIEKNLEKKITTLIK